MFSRFLDDKAIQFQFNLASRYKEIDDFQDAVQEIKDLAGQLKQISGTDIFQVQNYGQDKLNNVFQRLKQISCKLKTKKIKRIIKQLSENSHQEDSYVRDTEISKDSKYGERNILMNNEQEDLVFSNNELALVEKIILIIQYEIDEDKKKEMWRVTREYHLENWHQKMQLDLHTILQSIVGKEMIAREYGNILQLFKNYNNKLSSTKTFRFQSQRINKLNNKSM